MPDAAKVAAEGREVDMLEILGSGVVPCVHGPAGRAFHPVVVVRGESLPAAWRFFFGAPIPDVSIARTASLVAERLVRDAFGRGQTRPAIGGFSVVDGDSPPPALVALVRELSAAKWAQGAHPSINAPGGSA